MISIRITSLYVSQTSSVAFVCKTVTLGPQLQVSVGPRPHLWFFAGTLAPELQVTIDPSSHLCFFGIQNSAFSTRIAIPYGSQPSSVVSCIHNSDIMSGINSLYGSQTSPVILCTQNRVISTRTTSLQGAQTSPVVLWMQ